MRAVALPLGELAEVVSGGTPKRSKPEFFGGAIPWVKIGDMLQGTVTDTDECITDAGLDHSSAKILPAGTILLSIFATIGRTAVLGIDAATNQAVAGLRIRDSTSVHPNYLRRYLESASPGLAKQGRGVAQANINLSILRAHPVPLPPIEEQRRIAAVLDAAEALREKRRQALAKLDSLTQAVFLDMFGDPMVVSGWPRVRLAEVCQSKGEYGANVPAVEFDSNKPRYLRITDIRSDGTLTDKAVGPGGTEGQWSSKILSPGDILFARSGATVGKTFLVRDERAPLAFAGYLIKFVPDQQRILPEYLYRCTRTEKYRRWVAAAATTVAQPNVNASKYAKLELLLPPMHLQRQFVDVVERIRQHRATLEASSVAMDKLFASLQQRAFRGEL